MLRAPKLRVRIVGLLELQESESDPLLLWGCSMRVHANKYGSTHSFQSQCLEVTGSSGFSGSAQAAPLGGAHCVQEASSRPLSAIYSTANNNSQATPKSTHRENLVFLKTSQIY